jgi:hypothetical protein
VAWPGELQPFATISVLFYEVTGWKYLANTSDQAKAGQRLSSSYYKEINHGNQALISRP